MINGIRLNIDDDSKNPTNLTCFNLKGNNKMHIKVNFKYMFSITPIIYL